MLPSILALCRLPSLKEIQACWEMTRLGRTPITWFPFAYSAIMAYHALPDMSWTTLFQRVLLFLPLCAGVEAFIMTIDDLLDHDIDARVTRTKTRAIPRGDVTLPRAWLFLTIQAVSGMCLARSVLRPTTLWISMFSWPIFVIYPTCKRWMDFAPVPLGLMFNIGAFMGWTDVAPNIAIPTPRLSLLYVSTALWTITYETVYQHWDKKDDIHIGIHSIALFLDKHGISTNRFAALTATLCLVSFSYSAYLNGQFGPAFIVGTAVAAWIMILPLPSLDVNQPSHCRRYFRGIGEPVGFALLGALLGEAVLQRLVRGLAL